MEPQRRQETIFTAIEKDDLKVMLFRELWETFLHLKPPAGEHWLRPWGLEIGPRLYIDIYIYMYITAVVQGRFRGQPPLPQPGFQVQKCFQELSE